MLEINKDIEVGSLEEETLRIRKLNEKFINLHELNKKENEPIRFRVHNSLPSGMILVDDLNDFSNGIQSIYRKAINYKTVGPSKRLKKYIKNSTGLVITEVKAGSFEIEMKQHRSQILDENINSDFDTLTEGTPQHSLNDLSEIMSSLYNENLGIIVKNYGTDTINSTKEWFRKIYKTHNTFEYYTVEGSYLFDDRKIKNLKFMLDDFNEEKEEEKILEGRITALNHENSTIVVRDDSLNDNFTVKVIDEKFKNFKGTSNVKVKVPVVFNKILIGNEVVSTDLVLNDISAIDYTD